MTIPNEYCEECGYEEEECTCKGMTRAEVREEVAERKYDEWKDKKMEEGWENDKEN